jgi:iron complex outermembrane receptor protein
VKIKTKQPSKKFKSSVNVGIGSFNYKKFGASASGGNDTIRVAATISTESSDQYKDGNGDRISDQIDNYIAENPTAAGTALQAEHKDMEAYTKNSAMVKAFITTAKNQELRLSVTANRSDNILYGNSKMDAIYDDSNIYNAEYNIDAISDIVKNINFQAYHSDVDHPMGTDYRVSSQGANPVMTNWLTTDMDGLKLKSTFDVSDTSLIVGLDVSRRDWDGHYEKNHNPDYVAGGKKSIDNAVTDNAALFVKADKMFGKLKVSVGMRYDDTSITNDTYQSNDYTAFGANILTTYNFNRDNRLFFGLGQASRVPDARELYFLGSMGNLVGTPDLDQTTNQEIDLGYALESDDFKFKVKAFYSMLSDYIYVNTTNKNPMGALVNAFENIDATIYGAELSASYYINDDITLDMDASYKVGQKDQAMQNQTDTDLADIAPLRGSIALNYEYANNSIAMLKVRASDRWDAIDSDNGEQELAGWTTVDAKVKHAVNKKFDLTVGVNNLLNKAYAQSNTYADLTLITAGGSSDVMLMNEPGRYIYTNLDFKF